MINFSLLITRKDLRISLLHGNGTIQAILLGLLLIFLFDLSKNPGETASAQEASTIFWLSSIFCQLLIFNQLYAIEENNETRVALMLVPAPAQAVWLGKACAAFIILCIAQMFFLPAIIIFLGQNFSGDISQAIFNLVLVNIGICALGSLLGAIGQGKNGKDSILTIIIFPLLVPLLMAAIKSGSSAFGENVEDAMNWTGITAAFDAIFLSAGLLLFNFLYQGDE